MNTPGSLAAVCRWTARIVGTQITGLGVDVWDWANDGERLARLNAYAPLVVPLQTNFPANPGT